MNLLAFFDLYQNVYLGLHTHPLVPDQEFQSQLILLLQIPHREFVMHHLQKLQEFKESIRSMVAYKKIKKNNIKTE